MPRTAPSGSLGDWLLPIPRKPLGVAELEAADTGRLSNTGGGIENWPVPFDPARAVQ